MDIFWSIAPSPNDRFIAFVLDVLYAGPNDELVRRDSMYFDRLFLREVASSSAGGEGFSSTPFLSVM